VSGSVILEDICLSVDGSCNNNKLKDFFIEMLPDVDRLLLVPDNHFSFLVETATEIQAQIAIDSNTGVTKDGSLRYQELLPADTVMYTLVFFANERADAENLIQIEALREAVIDAVSTHIQIGGDMTLGRGIFEVTWKGATESEGGAR
jgi:CRISPR-associated protein Cmr4